MCFGSLSTDTHVKKFILRVSGSVATLVFEIDTFKTRLNGRVMLPFLCGHTSRTFSKFPR